MIGAPLDLGAGRRGVDMGPSAIRYAGLEQQLADKLGVRVTRRRATSISPVVETTAMGDERARYLAADPRPLRPARRRSSRRRAGRGRAAARARRRPLRRARLARRDGAGARAPAASSGSTRTATSTRRRPRRPATSTGWCSPRRSGSRGDAFARDGWPLPAVEPGRSRSSASARSTKGSGSCSAGSTRRSSR